MKKKGLAALGVLAMAVFGIGFAVIAHALTLSENLNVPAIDLVNNVLGEGIVADNATRSGTVYEFSDGASGVGIESGIVLDTSGRVDASSADDPDLANIMDYRYGGHTSSLEFELEANGTLLNFNYVFGSSEFDQRREFNDVFGLFVSVNGGEYENIALITRNDGQQVPVSITDLKNGLDNNEFVNYPVAGRTYSLYHAVEQRFYESSTKGAGITNGISNVFNAQKEVSVGDRVKVKFVVADVSDQKYDSYVLIEASSLSFDPPGVRVNYFDENLIEFDPNTEYVVWDDGVEYRFTSDENGKVPAVGSGYDFFGETLDIAKVGVEQAVQTLEVAERPDPPALVTETTADNILPNTAQVAETSITIVAGEGQQYRVDNGEWQDPIDGIVVFDDLDPDTVHEVFTRYVATNRSPASYSSEGARFSTLEILQDTVTGYRGLYDGAPHTVNVGQDATIMYANAADGEYNIQDLAYTEPGVYNVYYELSKDGYASVRGTATIEIIEWTASDVTNAEENYGEAMLVDDVPKDIIPITAEDEAELLDHPVATMWLTVEDVTDSVNEATVGLVEEALSENEHAVVYFDVNLYKKIGELPAEIITQAETPVKVEFSPVVATDDGVVALEDGEYTMIRVHNGAAEELSAIVENGKMSFATDKFSVYALAVVNEPQLDPDEPGSDEPTIPDDPVDPVDPVDDPVDPVGPIDPEVPETPTDPVKPAGDDPAEDRRSAASDDSPVEQIDMEQTEDDIAVPSTAASVDVIRDDAAENENMAAPNTGDLLMERCGAVAGGWLAGVVIVLAGYAVFKKAKRF